MHYLCDESASNLALGPGLLRTVQAALPRMRTMLVASSFLCSLAMVIPFRDALRSAEAGLYSVVVRDASYLRFRCKSRQASIHGALLAVRFRPPELMKICKYARRSMVGIVGAGPDLQRYHSFEVSKYRQSSTSSSQR